MTNSEKSNWVDMGDVESGMDLETEQHKGRYYMYNSEKPGQILSSDEFYWPSDWE